MKGTLLLVVGVSGSGKSTLMKRLSADGLDILTPSTTRDPRANEIDPYEFLDPANWHSSEFAWETQVGTVKYGVKKSQLNSIKRGVIAASFFHQSLLYKVQGLSEAYDLTLIVVMLDTVSDLTEQSRRVSNDLKRLASSEASLKSEIEELRSHADLILNGDADSIVEAVLTSCRLIESKGVLAQQDIHILLKAGTLLEGSQKASVEPCSYDLHLGDEVWCRGKITKLSDHDSIFSLPAYSYAIVKARELAAIPSFVVARFDLTVGMFFRGLILSNGPQVDPGYRGALFCLLFNASDVDIPIKYGEHMATVEFTIASRPAHSYKGQHQGKKSLAEFLDKESGSSKGGNIVKRIEALESNKRLPFIAFWASVSVICLGVGGYVANGLIDIRAVSKQVEDDKKNMEEYMDSVKDDSTNLERVRGDISLKVENLNAAKLDMEKTLRDFHEAIRRAKDSGLDN
jgi:deoxycytidine triphosphate deaminase/guanylate kinase